MKENNYFLHHAKILSKSSFIRYLIVGITAFSVEYGTFIILFMIIDLNLYFANGASFFIGLITSFILNRKWTFKDNNSEIRVHNQLLMYIVLALLNLLITSLIIKILVTYGIVPVIGKIITMGMIVVWNYIIFNHIIFSSKKDT